MHFGGFAAADMFLGSMVSYLAVPVVHSAIRYPQGGSRSYATVRRSCVRGDLFDSLALDGAHHGCLHTLAGQHRPICETAPQHSAQFARQ